MTEPYTPTTEEVRALIHEVSLSIERRHGLDHSEALSEFDRWIAQHDREVAAGALRDAATMRLGYSRGAAIAEHHGCHKHQCRCGNPGPEQMIELVTSAWQGALQERAISILHP